jgi:sarcosine oxidase subunit gamma
VTAEPRPAPAPRAPLHHLAEALAAAAGPELALREVALLTQIGLRCDPADAALAARLAGALGAALPTDPNTVAAAGARRVLWLGPDEWLVVDEPGAAPALLDALYRAGAGALVTTVDLSANRTTLELTGAQAPDALAKGCALDLHPRAFAAGACAQTLVARAQVVLDQVDDRPTYRLHVRGSFAAYLASWLLDAARDVTPDHERPPLAAARG